METRPQSSKPRKQRKWLIDAPLHKRQKMLVSTLSKELRTKYKRRSLSVRKGDKVKVMRGEYKGTIGQVMKVSLKEYTIYVDSVKAKKANGTEVPRPLNPSNVMITEIMTEDKERRDLLERKTK
jgi:large subunit ribosomal protein L24